MSLISLSNINASSTEASDSGLICCDYCKISDTSSLVRCQAKDCGRWFCNNKIKSHDSHIFFHLKHSNHREIAPFSTKNSQPSSFYCEKCNETNVFCLSLLEYRGERKILCSNSCMNLKQYSQFKRLATLVTENIITSYLVKRAAKERYENTPNLDFHALKNEELARSNSLILDTSTSKPLDFALENVKDKYDSVEEYHRIFNLLLDAEEAGQKERTKAYTQYNVKINWTKTDGNLYADLDISNEYHYGGRLSSGDSIVLKADKDYKFSVVSAHRNEKIRLVAQRREIPPSDGNGFTLELVWMNSSIQTMKDGLNKFARGKAMSQELYSYVLGKSEEKKEEEVPENKQQPVQHKETNSVEIPEEKKIDEVPAKPDYAIVERFKLNEFQLEAIDRAIRALSLFLIQGPPGTGKTQTLAALVALLEQCLGKNDKLLICAPSNTAVDNLTERLISYGVQGVCRMYAASKEKMNISNPHLEGVALHKKIQTLSNRLKNLWERKNSGDRLSLRESREFPDLKKEYEEEVFQSAKIICCTCISAGDKRLAKMDFKCVLVDEAGQATEPECLLPWLHKAEKVVMVGDHKQIGPIVSFSKATQTGYNRSLFERLIEKADHYMLKVQYRMNPLIAKFPSEHFYNDELKTHSSIRQRKINKNFPWIRDQHILFCHVEGKEEVPPSAVSYLNREEAVVVRNMVEGLIRSGVKPSQIGIVTPYNGQKGHLRDLIEKRSEWKDQVEVASIDEFQGREKDYIVISCVRSNKELGVGFLSDERRLNVALTRAKDGMIICGNAKVLAQDPHWRELLKFYAHRGLIVEGGLGSWKPVKIDLD